MKARSAFLSMLLLSCAAPAAPPSSAAEPKPSPSAPSRPPPRSSEPAVRAPPSAEPRFFEIARSIDPKQELRVLRLGPEVVVNAWSRMAPIQDDRVIVDRDLSEGLVWLGNVIATGGQWPNDAWLTFITSNGRIGWGELYRWDKSAWIKKSQLRQGEVFLGMASWKNGRLLTLSIDSMPFRQPMQHTFRVVGGGVVPKLARGKGKCMHATRAHGFTALETGHVFVVGKKCRDDEVEEPVVEWWAPGDTKSTISELVGAKLGGAWFDETVVQAVALDEGEILLSGGQFLARLKGGTFRLVEAPGSVVSALATAEDGTVWAVFDGRVHSSDGKGPWKLEPIAGDARASSLVVRGGDVFVSSGASVFGLRAPAGGVQTFGFEQPGEARSFKVARPADKYCESVFALLYAFTKLTPEDYDFPLTRKALKGQTRFSKARFVITEEGARKYLGAFTPSYALGKELVARIEKEVQGSKPALLCAEPRVLREFPLDLASGELTR